MFRMRCLLLFGTLWTIEQLIQLDLITREWGVADLSHQVSMCAPRTPMVAGLSYIITAYHGYIRIRFRIDVRRHHPKHALIPSAFPVHCCDLQVLLCPHWTDGGGWHLFHWCVPVGCLLLPALCLCLLRLLGWKLDGNRVVFSSFPAQKGPLSWGFLQ